LTQTRIVTESQKEGVNYDHLQKDLAVEIMHECNVQNAVTSDHTNETYSDSAFIITNYRISLTSVWNCTKIYNNVHDYIVALTKQICLIFILLAVLEQVTQYLNFK